MKGNREYAITLIPVGSPAEQEQRQQAITAWLVRHVLPRLLA